MLTSCDQSSTSPDNLVSTDIPAEISDAELAEILKNTTSTRVKKTSNKYTVENERVEFFEQVKKENPAAFRKEHEKNIEDGIVVVDMTPFEAKLAGGAFSYHVSADKEKWKDGTNPLLIMWEQTDYPDNSEINMTFQNHTQFDTDESVFFRVEVRQGKVVRIYKLEDK